MNSKATVGILLLLATGAASGQPAGVPRAAVIGAPTVTILTAASGAMILNQGPGSASLNLGGVSCFRGTSAAGESSKRTEHSFVVATRFTLRVDCPGSPASAQVTVTMSRMDAAASHAMSIDGMKLGTMAQILEQSILCGSSAEHRLEVEVPNSTPAGAIGSTVAFAATLKK
jgi:hypothetical protein